MTENPLERVLVLGAGYLGSVVAERLRSDGVSVRVCTRTGVRGELHPNIAVERLDIVGDSSDRIRELLVDVSAVLLSYSSGGGQQDRRKVYVDGGKTVLDALDGSRVARVVYCSSTSALPDLDANLTEACDEWPTAARGRVQREAESMMCDGLSKLGVPWFVLRLAGLYGPGRELGRLYRRDPSAPLSGNGQRPTNLIHRDDAATAVIRALGADPSSYGLVNVCDDDHCTRREMIDALARRDGLPPPRWERDVEPGSLPVGKRVDNALMKRLFGDFLAHRGHRPCD